MSTITIVQSVIVIVWVVGIGAAIWYVHKHEYWNLELGMWQASDFPITLVFYLFSWLLVILMWFMDNKTTKMDAAKARFQAYYLFAEVKGYFPGWFQMNRIDRFYQANGRYPERGQYKFMV